ncbi:MAG: helix-turn-helix domain-containing protein [Anaerolineae bacterium]
MSSDESAGWVSLSEAAKVLGVHPATVRNWADQGHVPSQRTPGGHRRFRLADLEAWVQSQNSSNAAEAQVVVQSAMGRARFEMGEGHFAEASWYRKLDSSSREAMGVWGRRLMEVLQRYLASSSEQALTDAREIGLKYGDILHGHGLKLTEAVEGFFTFQDFILDALIKLLEVSRPSGERSDSMRKIYAFTREMILALVEKYEA